MAQQPNNLQLREQDLTDRTVEFPRRFPLVVSPANRDDSTTKDARLVNCYVERDPKTGEYSIFGRPGTLLFSSIADSTGRGAYNWNGDVYAIFNGDVYKNGTDIGNVSNSGFYDFDASLNPSRLVFKNISNAYFTDGATVTAISDADFPANTVPGWGYLDSTLYVTKPATADVRGSDLNSVSAWDPLNSIIAQIEPDQAVAMAKQLVYVIVFKQWSTEVFYDAANATGSPLGRVQGAKVGWGCIDAQTVRELTGVLIWVAYYAKGNQSSAVARVVMMDNLKVKVISTPAINRLLEGAAFTTTRAFTLSINGHRFYVLSLITADLTLAYDLDEDMWHQWTDSTGSAWPYVAACPGATAQTHILQHTSNGNLYLCSTDYFTDDGSIITKDIITPNFDGGIRRQKMLNRLTAIGDQTSGSELLVRRNDEDYATDKWTNWRAIDLGQPMPYIEDEGTFYRRAYHFRHKSPTRFHISAMEMTLGMGTL